MKKVLRIQDVFGDFLRSFKVFIDKVTGNSINKMEWNYGSKVLEYHYMQDGHESFEYPVALINIQDIQPVDSVSPIMRTVGNLVSPHSTYLCENKTQLETIVVEKRFVNLLFEVVINTEDVTSMLNMHYMFLQHMPLNFMFYDYKYWGYLETTPVTYTWDVDNDDLVNLSIKLDPTYRYPAADIYNESHDADGFFTTQERDREAFPDDYPTLEGERHFAQIMLEPIIKLTSLTKQTDKESNQHSLNLNFEARIEIPQLLVKYKDPGIIETIEIVIDTTGHVPQNYPILIDMEENFYRNKNIQQGIMIFSENFILPEDEVEPYLEIKTDINTELYSLVLWAVEDVTTASSKRFFIPLEHARIERIEENGEFQSLRFYFSELKWFYGFDFENLFNYMKIIQFAEEQP